MLDARQRVVTFSLQRTALKRTCIKTLPDVLVIQLKRFVYDWEAGRSVKFDQYFEFPHEIDMKPYLSEQVEKKDANSKRQGWLTITILLNNMSLFVVFLIKLQFLH